MAVDSDSINDCNRFAAQSMEGDMSKLNILASAIMVLFYMSAAKAEQISIDCNITNVKNNHAYTEHFEIDDNGVRAQGEGGNEYYTNSDKPTFFVKTKTKIGFGSNSS